MLYSLRSWEDFFQPKFFSPKFWVPLDNWNLKVKIFKTSKAFLCHFGKTTIPWLQMPYNIYIVQCVSSVAESCPALCDPMDCMCQAPLCMGFFRQEYWTGLPFPSPGDLPTPGIKSMSPVSPAWQGNSLPLRQLGSTYYTASIYKYIKIQICINREEITGSIGIERSINISKNIIPPYQEWNLCLVMV